MFTLIEEVKQLIDRHPEADFYERQCLLLAAHLLANCREELFGEKVPEAVLPLMKVEEYLTLPDRFELIEGRVHPKDWDMYVEAQRRRGDLPG